MARAAVAMVVVRHFGQVLHDRGEDLSDQVVVERGPLSGSEAPQLHRPSRGVRRCWPDVRQLGGHHCLLPSDPGRAHLPTATRRASHDRHAWRRVRGLRQRPCAWSPSSCDRVITGPNDSRSASANRGALKGSAQHFLEPRRSWWRGIGMRRCRLRRLIRSGCGALVTFDRVWVGPCTVEGEPRGRLKWWSARLPGHRSDRAAWRRATRPRPCKLAANPVCCVRSWRTS